MRISGIHAWLPLLLFCMCLLFTGQAVAESSACRFIVDRSASQAYLLTDEHGMALESCHPDKLLAPASILKIPTALAALHLLGKDYRFKTSFYIDSGKNLYIKGFGDPILVSEEIERIMVELRSRGVQQINDIVIDPSANALESLTPGAEFSGNPYDAPVAPLAVNFNTIHFRVDKTGKVDSNEVQTPFIPLMKELGKSRKHGKYRVNILQPGADAMESSSRYVVELFRSIQQRLSIEGQGSWRMGPVDPGATLVYDHESSRRLVETLRTCLEYSSNFIANQVFLACGTARYGFPATWEKGRKAVLEQLNDLLGEEYIAQVEMVEGSGLSRRNRVTAAAMIRTLEVFRPYKDLLSKRNGSLVKSGTLSDVFSYAGYLAGEKPFVIIVNGKTNLRDTLFNHLISAGKQLQPLASGK